MKMALYDNKYWLLSHIRNSFISTDDTGMCELIMTGEGGVRKHLKETLDFYPDSDDSEDEDDLPHESFDLQLDMDFSMRYRTNTAARLEKMEQIKRKASRVRHIKWEVNKSPMTQEVLDDMFGRKEPRANKNATKKKSLCSEIFKQYSNLPSNPYIVYAKYDGSEQVNVPTKKYRIFITMLPEQQRNYPLFVCCIGGAKIQDLIGLILLKCSTNYKDHTWKSVANYGLYITEEDGEVDRDFPCLDARENIFKFGFTCLGLVEHGDSSKSVTFDNSETLAISKSFEDRLERRSTKDSSKTDQEKQISTDLQLINVHNKAMEAPLYKSYRVYVVNKVRAKVEIHLGISGEKIEIDPVQQTSKFSLVKQKPVSHHINTIAWCEITDVKSSRTVFKLVYSLSSSFGGGTSQDSHFTGNVSGYSGELLHASASFKNYDFEADHGVAEEVVQKINLILELRSSDVRKEYLATQERRKHYKKKSFNLTK